MTRTLLSAPLSIFSSPTILAFPLALCLLFLAGLPASAQAQSSFQTHSSQTRHEDRSASSIWKETVDEQLVRLLRSSQEGVRADAMRLIIELNARYGEALDLRRCAPRLLHLAKEAPVENHRILALTALYEVRSDETLQQLSRAIPLLSSGRVRQHALRILAMAQSAKPQS